VAGIKGAESYDPAPFFMMVMMVQFIRGIPVELDEAAEIDGCSSVGIFFRIILLLTKPGPMSLALRSFADPSPITNWGTLHDGHLWASTQNSPGL
jgi:ABC-type maltose transport system permease subunit